MGAIGGMLGLNGGMGGTGFSATNPVTAAQLGQSYDQSNAAMAQQNSLLSALQNQQGLQKQSDVYGQFQNIANGQGPNPAQAMLNQATGANVANQASLMAGQRGAGQNVGLMARQAAQQGANIQQQAAGQGASMQAQQSIGALGQAAGMANTMSGNQIGQTNANVNSRQNEQNMLLGANTAYNNVQGQLANTTLGNQAKMIGGIGQAGASAAGMGFAEGGDVPGSSFGPQSMFGQALNSGSAQGSMPQFNSSQENPFQDWGKKKQQPQATPSPVQSPLAPQSANYAGPDMGNVQSAAHGGKVDVLLSPGELKLDPNNAKMVAQGKMNPMAAGSKVPGTPKVKGNSYANDTYKDELKPGTIIIPNSIMQSKNPAKGAADFVRDVMAKKGKR